jgi:hypothetical protein
LAWVPIDRRSIDVRKSNAASRTSELANCVQKSDDRRSIFMATTRSPQFGLKSLLAVTTIVAMGLAVHVCPPPAGPLLMKVVAGIALFVPVLLAMYCAEWFERF